MITDSYGRKINYLRVAVTDRCNLRCTYCMPANGLNWFPRKDIMTDEEMLRICNLFVKMGVEKIRFTGGEPFVRSGFLSFLETVSHIKGLHELTLTTNGVLTAPVVPQLKKAGIRSVNLSLDTLDEDRFFNITQRKGLDKVLATLHALLENEIAVKINAVVMDDKNIDDIIPLVELTKTLPVSVRFIEEMPFNGSDKPVSFNWNFAQILKHIRAYFPGIIKITDPPNATSFNYRIPGHNGDVGIIAAYTRSFCGTCNRIRITPTGVLRTCLYDAGSFNIKEAIRSGITDDALERLIREAILKKPENGWIAEKENSNKAGHESMATIGG
ncbi:MAG: GTP 3',8-cyclase MoaA [Agriterribacter sp.]